MAHVPPARHLQRAKDLADARYFNHSAPEKRPSGIDSGFRDPSGNSFRLTQVQLPAAV